MKVLFACAGSGGHVNPAIAMANMLLKHDSHTTILFVGTKTGLENKLVKNAGFEMAHIRTGKLIRSLTMKNVKALCDTYQGTKEAKKLVKEFKPDLVIGTGGYICVPVMLAAKKFKIPYILHESNAYPGIAVKLLAKGADTVMLGFEDAKARLNKRANCVYTGTPAKFDVASFSQLNKMQCQKRVGLEHIHKKIILVTCGSQGAKKVNETVLEMLDSKQLPDFFIVLVTGENSYDQIASALTALEEKHQQKLDACIRLEKFVFDMESMYKACDMCVTRAGAMTITELAITGKPAILIPLPTAAENHQYYNAKVLQEVGAGVILEQKELTASLLQSRIEEMLQTPKLETMSTQAKTLVMNGVEEKIYACLQPKQKKR